jgi:hypothetical protein
MGQLVWYSEDFHWEDECQYEMAVESEILKSLYALSDIVNKTLEVIK